MKLEEFKVYQMAMELAEKIWKIVILWNQFEKDTIGKQLVKAADAIAANLSEGFGRFHYRENRHFGYIARGSLFETKTWLTKAFNRNLVDEKDFSVFMKNIDQVAVKLNRYLKAIGNTDVVDEGPESYGFPEQ